MKRYLLFGGNHFYAGGGWNDLLGVGFDTIAEALTATGNASPVTERAPEWWHVVDTATGEIVRRDLACDGWGNL